jgi:uncharacterized protein YqjF (DUF2071 family)
MSFLKAEWRKLAFINYSILPEVLNPYVPEGTELDLWNGKCYISLIGFLFQNTKLLGRLKVPFHVNFEEVNLRFYVKREVNGEKRRGVVFVKEMVPRPAITIVANTLYNEHYQAVPMRHSWDLQSDPFRVNYSWKAGGRWHDFSVMAKEEPEPIPENSDVEFITEHYWGYNCVSANETVEYRVTHPRWWHYPVVDYQLNVDFERTYGPDFAFLNEEEPASVMLPEGSAITVESREKLVLPQK